MNLNGSELGPKWGVKLWVQQNAVQLSDCQFYKDCAVGTS